MHAAARGPADRPDQKRYHVSGEAPEYLPAGLGRVTLLPSGRRTRSVHEGAGLGFALTQHAHIVITAVLYTRTTVALALPQAPSHTRRSLPFQGLTAACACPKSPPPPKGVLLFQTPAAASARTPGTPAARASQALSAGAYACRSSPLLLSATPTTSFDITRYQSHSRFPFRVTSSGSPRILLTTSCLAPAGAAPANTPPRQLMPGAVWPHARLSLGAAIRQASRAWLTPQARSWACGALEEEEACRGHPVLPIGTAHHTL